MTNDLEELENDVRDLAQSLLDDAVTGPIIRRRGKFQFFTDEEEKKVINFAEKAEFLNIFENERQFKRERGGITLEMYKLSNRDVAIGTARRVAEGEFQSVDDVKARALIKDNMMPHDMSVWEWIGHGGTTDLNSPWRGRTIALEDFHLIFKEYIKDPNLPDLYRKWNETNHAGEDMAEIYDAVNERGTAIMRRYGLIRGCSFAHLGQAVLRLGIDYNDVDALCSVIRDRNLNRTYTKIKELDHE